MRLSKNVLKRMKTELLAKIAEVHLMSDKQLLKEAHKTATFKAVDPTRNDLIAWILKWAVHDIIPSSMVD